MTVKELKEILEKVPEEYPVKVWVSSEGYDSWETGYEADITDTGIFNGEKLFTIEV